MINFLLGRKFNKGCPLLLLMAKAAVWLNSATEKTPQMPTKDYYLEPPKIAANEQQNQQKCRTQFRIRANFTFSCLASVMICDLFVVIFSCIQ